VLQKYGGEKNPSEDGLKVSTATKKRQIKFGAPSADGAVKA
jgi:hypothetical protein